MGEYQVLRDVDLGSNVRIHHFVNLYGCRIGDDSAVGSFVEIQKGVVLGRRCKVGSHSFICEAVTLGDDVFVGHHVVFINDKYPVSQVSGKPTRDGDWKPVATRVERGASIGSGAVILCGVTIGEEAMIGAGAVVTRNVPARAVVVGNPARLRAASRAQEMKHQLGWEK